MILRSVVCDRLECRQTLDLPENVHPIFGGTLALRGAWLEVRYRVEGGREAGFHACSPTCAALLMGEISS